VIQQGAVADMAKLFEAGKGRLLPDLYKAEATEKMGRSTEWSVALSDQRDLLCKDILQSGRDRLPSDVG